METTNCENTTSKEETKQIDIDEMLKFVTQLVGPMREFQAQIRKEQFEAEVNYDAIGVDALKTRAGFIIHKRKVDTWHWLRDMSGLREELENLVHKYSQEHWKYIPGLLK